MASDKRNNRGKDDKKGPQDPRRRRVGLPFIEELEHRRLLDGSPWKASSTDLYNSMSGPMANLGPILIKAYRDYSTYVQAGSKGTFQSSLSQAIEFKGTSVGITVTGIGDFNSFVRSVSALGMQVASQTPINHTVDGFIPIANLPQLAAGAQVRGARPVFVPIAYQQGIANNESDVTLSANVARTTYGVDGTGQKIGVLSNSVNQYQGGLADSVKTGDLPSNVQIIADGGAGEPDEGRAMLEQIYDIAPGAQLGFATAGPTPGAFANNIVALKNAGYNTIVDDVGFLDEPFYQDGTVANAVNTVVAGGATYLSSAGNSADAGYESQFRGVNASVGSVGAGRYMNFDGSGATTTTTLGLAVSNPGGAQAFLAMQFDQPFGSATSILELDVYDSNNNLVGTGLTNNFATGDPLTVVTDSTGNPINFATGLYKVAVKVNSGADPGHIFMYQFGEADFAFDKSFGSAGGTYYPTTFGHPTATTAIGVGAVPFWGAPPYQTSGPYYSETFSSFGPVVKVFNADGSALSSPQVVLKPDISAPDGNNTSFFSAGQFLDTSTFVAAPYLSYPGNAQTTFPSKTTATNQAQPNLPTFFGTSSAAPNLAAVVALMKQLNPSITRNQILSNLITTATPLNGATAGTWTPQGGYGLANAVAALAKAAQLNVTNVTPGSSQTINAVPTSITVTFSKAINLSTLTSGSIIVTAPNGAQVTVGNPIGVDSSTTPSVVRFPISITPAPGRVANGQYTVTVPAGRITAADGTMLQQAYSTNFTLAVTTAPTVVSTSFVGRVVTVTFSAPVIPSTINKTNVYIFRAGGVNNALFNPADVVVSNLPGATLSYNASTLTATIDLTNVPQAQLPTDRYALVVSPAVTDQVGNPLNGQFNGTFPSGINPSGNGTYFIQDRGVITSPAPVISSLVLNPSTDSGISGDSTTNINRPSFIGQIAAFFPSTAAGVTIYAQFNGIAHNGVASGGFDLGVGANGRGVVGQYDVVVTTDANGVFVINYPNGYASLPEGQNLIRIVAVNPTDAPPLQGTASTFTTSFVVDRTSAYVSNATVNGSANGLNNASVNNLTSVTLSVIDPVNPMSTTSPFGVNTQSKTPALNPATAQNLANYQLLLVTGVNQFVDESSYLKNAVFTSTSARTSVVSPYTGTVTLTFGSNVPTGHYVLVVKSSITDAAGNALTDNATDSSTGTIKNYMAGFDLQPTPTYITRYGAYSLDTSTGYQYGVISQPRASYEVMAAGTTPAAPAPPTAFTIDFSNQLNLPVGVNLSGYVQLARSANSATSKPDGNFGNFGTTAGLTNPTGFSLVSGINVQLVNGIGTAVAGQQGYLNRLFITIPAGTTLSPDYYRLYLPNVTTSSGTNAISDVYGNQLDGEFLGYQNADGKFVDKLNDGTVRGSGSFDEPDISGDGKAGGAFMTGFVVVPNGNVIFARPDAIFNPTVSSNIPDGTINNPYPVLAAEATATTANGGDLNSVVNYGANFNSIYDRSGLGTFQPSAFFAAQEKARLTQAPVVIIAQAAIPARDPFTGVVTQRPFVLQAPSGADPVINDGSAAVPAMTTLVFAAGSVLKMQNASLLVQNQGSALQISGGANPSQIVYVTSYKDSTIGGATNGDPSSTPMSGDYGGILFRNYDETNRSSLFPGQLPLTGAYQSDGRLKGPFTSTTDRLSQLDAVSGADSIMSYINYLVERYAGGNVPQTVGFGYDGITLQNSRPGIANTTIALAGVGAAQAGLSVDVNSLRQDDIASGPLLRNLTLAGNGLNGIYIRGEATSGLAQGTNATTNSGAASTYVLNSPYPYILTTQIEMGRSLQVESGGLQNSSADRLFLSPGTILKFARGAGVQIDSNSMLNTGDTTYINGFLASGTAYRPGATNFKANSSTLSNVILTSLYDDTAATTFTDPTTGAVRSVTAALPAVPGGSGSLQPTAGNVPDAARWGGVAIASGAVAVINSTILRYGGGSINSQSGTGTRHVLEVDGGSAGARISVTNNTFSDNSDVPINLQPDSLRATDAQVPLSSGAAFIHGNLFLRNDYNAVGVQGGTQGPIHNSNMNSSDTWTGGDFTYLLRDTILLGPGPERLGTFATSTSANPTLPNASVTLTLQSTLPGTVLADGTTVAAPGVPLVIKTLNQGSTPIAEAAGVNPAAGNNAYWQGGAGFIVGVDDGVDPPAVDPLLDDGVWSQIRILGIPANQSTGQARVPVIITSIYDDTVGTTVNGTSLNQVITGNTTAPKAGDGGVIYFGGNSLPTYNLQDIRNGSVIDNADIKYITRIEQQGGGIMSLYDANGDAAISPADNPYRTKYGIAGNGTAYNSPKKLVVSNSNLSTFSDGGIFSHAGFGAISVDPINLFIPTRIGGLNGEPTQLYVVNTTITGMTQGRAAGIEMVSYTGDVFVTDNGVASSPSMLVVQNSTFYNDTVGVNIVGDAADGLNGYSHVAALVFDSIFSNITGVAFQGTGQIYGSDSQYNLFNQVGGQVAGGIANSQPITGDPSFRDAVNGNFNLLPNSAAIDRARSELNNSIFGDMLYPSFTINPANINQRPTRNSIGDVDTIGGYNGGISNSLDTVTLPGLPVSERGFPDQWVPVTSVTATGTTVSAYNPTDPRATSGTRGNGYFSGSTYSYVPIQGERDQLGNLRVKDPNSPNTGFGSRPFFDLGAFEYIIQNPPVVTSIVAVSAAATTSLYAAGQTVGTNVTPNQIRVGFNERLNPATLTATSVLLVGSGGDGVFGNGNDVTYNLNNRLTFDNNGNYLYIDTTNLFPSGTASNDLFMLTLKGTGSNIIRDNDGLALDGYTANDSIPLPSGTDQFPGSDFAVQFTIDTNAPSLVSGSFGLAPGSFTTAALTGSPVTFPITKDSTPTFVGKISDIFPPSNPLLGDTVYVDISTKGDGNFDRLAAATGTTDANGNFSVTVTNPLPDSNVNVGPDGKYGTADDTGSSTARVRIVDQAGNMSSLTTTPLSTLEKQGAAFNFELDTQAPTVTSLTPTASAVVAPNGSGQVIVTATFSENINPATLNATNIVVTRTGGTGVFGANAIAVPIVAGSINITYLKTPAGAIQVQFALQGPLPNDFYQITLKGSGTAPITDLAGNPLNGGTDYINGPVTVFAPTASRLIFVSDSTGVNDTATGRGSRALPYKTIQAAINAASFGDVVAVLSGTYRESITLKAQVRVLSAASSSTDTSLLPGNPTNTLIYGGSASANNNYNNTTTGTVVVMAQNIGTVANVPTELSGFSIIAPLLGDSVRGTIDTTSVGVALYSADVLLDKNFILNAGYGVNISTSGSNVNGPKILDNLIIGNLNGIGIADGGSTTSYARPTQVINNTIADNTVGLYNVSATPGVTQAYVLNDIFYNNHDLTTNRSGYGVLSMGANTLVVGTNLFYNNGVSGAPSSNASGTFANFRPAFLTTVPDAFGNYLGDPAFVNPRDPRPNADSPPVFFLYGNYDLSSRSPAINAALQAVAPATDILYRTPVRVVGKGFNGSGPASIGAYYYNGTGGINGSTGTTSTPIVVVTSPTSTTSSAVSSISVHSVSAPSSTVSPPTSTATSVGSSTSSSGGTVSAAAVSAGSSASTGSKGFSVASAILSPATSSMPTTVTVNFSKDVDVSSVKADDLVLSGSGVNASNPAKATSLAWIDGHSVNFLLSGQLNSTGNVNLAINSGAVQDTAGDSIDAFVDSIDLASATSGAAAATPMVLASPVVVNAVGHVAQPVAVAGPVVVHYNKARFSKNHHVGAAQLAASAKSARINSHQVAAKAAKHQTTASTHAAKAKSHKAE